MAQQVRSLAVQTTWCIPPDSELRHSEPIFQPFSLKSLPYEMSLSPVTPVGVRSDKGKLELVRAFARVPVQASIFEKKE